MSQSQKLTSRFREVFLDGTWIANTNYKKALQDVSLEQALTTVGDHNPIWLLTCHVNYYVAGVLQVLQGGTLDIHDKYSFDFEPPATEAEWQIMKQTLFNNSEAFAVEIKKLTDTQLQAFFVKEAYGDYQRSIDGMMEHAYYHLGQISLLKKLTM